MRYENMTRANDLSIEADISDALSMLKSLGANEKRTMKRILSAVGTDAKNKAKKAYKGTGLQKRSGELHKSIIRKVLKGGKEVLISAKARNERNIFYGYALAKGSVIRPREKAALHFQIDGKWVTATEVRLKPHDFIEAPVRSYLSSTAFKEKLDKLVHKEIERIEKERMKNADGDAGS